MATKKRKLTFEEWAIAILAGIGAVVALFIAMVAGIGGYRIDAYRAVKTEPVIVHVHCQQCESTKSQTPIAVKTAPTRVKTPCAVPGCPETKQTLTLRGQERFVPTKPCPECK